MALLDVRDLVVEFPNRRGSIRPLDGVSFTIDRGEVLGIVGESGAGKTLTGSAIIGLIEPPGRIMAGEIRLAGERIDTLPPRRLRLIRGARIGTIPQNPMTSLDPLHTVGQQLVETIQTHLGLSDRVARQRALNWLEEVGIPVARERFDDHPHKFSGGMRQRVAVALALCAEPAVLIADEPTTALDLSVQAQIIGLLRRVTRDRGTAMMLVTHDMGVVSELADRVAVMYAGRIIETGPVHAVIRGPAHPYTVGLMRCIPPVDRRVERLAQIDGAMPRPGVVPAGCAFHTRCDHVLQRCRVERQTLLTAVRTQAACWRSEVGSWPGQRSGITAQGEDGHAWEASSGYTQTDVPGLLAVSVQAPSPESAGRPAAQTDAGDRTSPDRGLNEPPYAQAGAGCAATLLARGSDAPAVHCDPHHDQPPLGGGAVDPGSARNDPATPERKVPLLELEHVSHWFGAPASLVRRLAGGATRRLLAVDDVTLGIDRGSTLALVGESGCGKTTLARLAVGLLEPERGAIRFAGQPISATRTSPALRRRMNMIFQDPHGSLNPRWRVRDIIAEPIRRFDVVSEAALRGKVDTLLALVGLVPEDGARYPHAFSGGQRQRIAIARALSANPDFLACDEPTSALDVSVQAQILNLIRDLQGQLGLTCLFISHDMAVVRQMADQVGVMYLGRIVELGVAELVLSRPRHPYTRLLLDAAPDLTNPRRGGFAATSEAPSPWDPPSGCGFRLRCPLATSRCASERPALLGGKDGTVACHAVQEGRAG